MIRVLLVDDEARLRQAWERLLAPVPDMQCVGALPQADGVLDAVTAMSPDIVLLDLSMPGSDPLLTIRELVRAHPDIRAVVYSGRSDEHTLREVFDAGAWGYLDKLSPPEEIINSLRRVASGEVVFPVSIPKRQPESA